MVTNVFIAEYYYWLEEFYFAYNTMMEVHVIYAHNGYWRRKFYSGR